MRRRTGEMPAPPCCRAFGGRWLRCRQPGLGVGPFAADLGAVAALGVTLLVHAQAHALSVGISGNSGKQGAICADCHDGGAPPVVRFEGPREVIARTLATFRFVVESQSLRQSLAGFNVAASGGVLEELPHQGVRREADEITHDGPQATVDGQAVWEFTWRAASQPGVETLYGAGLSVNGNGTRSGDAMSATTLRVAVTSAPRGDANCDARRSVADLTAVLLLLPTGVPAGCERADADCDGLVDENDAALILASLFDPMGGSPCDTTARPRRPPPAFACFGATPQALPSGAGPRPEGSAGRSPLGRLRVPVNET